MSGYYRDFFRLSVLQMQRQLPAALAVIALLVSSGALFADTQDPPLFVAPDGVDSGNCQNEAAPCRSIDFALQRVGKNGQVRIAAGTYELSAPENVFYLVSNAIDVRAERGATLVGAPQEFAGQLGARGFRVIVDTKSLDRDTARKLGATKRSLAAATSATACAGGFAGAFPCDSVDLVAHVANRAATASGADIWGFVDLNTSREYAIMGYSTGTAVYDVSDPENPREVGFVDGQRTTWRDIKIYQFWDESAGRYQAYAYVTADNASDGLFVLDLTELPHRISRVNYSGDFAEAHNVYMTKTDFSTGLALTDGTPVLVIAGSNRDDGRFRLYSLDDPRAPAFIARPATPADQPAGNRLYMHDAASTVIRDTRKDSMCVNAATSPYCDLLVDFNESSVDLWDITDPATPARISRTPYGNSGYTHSGWLSEDQSVIYVQDELDERDRILNTTLRAFVIADRGTLSTPYTWTGPTRSIDHNGFARGNRYYMSNYASGLTILDIANVADIQTAGRFDTYPSSDSGGFPGAWGTYPFLPSGNILVSDIDSGFFVVADRTRDEAPTILEFSAVSFGGSEDENPTLTVRRKGPATGTVGLAWEVIPATADESDITNRMGIIDWRSGETGDKTIDLGIVNDGNVEGMERLIVKLWAPSQTANLGNTNYASVYISDPGNASTIGFMDASVDISERGFATAVVVVRRTGSARGAVSVDYAVSGGDATAGADYSGPASGTLTWSDGEAGPKTIEYAIVNDGSGEPAEFLELALSNVSDGTLAGNTALRINILDAAGTNTPPNSVAGTSQSVRSGTRVTLDGTASNDPDGDALSYSWTQTLGPGVSLSNADAAAASFTAPTVTSDTLLRFELSVSDPGGLSDTSNVSVTIRASGSSSSGSSGGGALSVWLLVLLLFERMRLYDRLLAIRSR